MEASYLCNDGEKIIVLTPADVKYFAWRGGVMSGIISQLKGFNKDTLKSVEKQTTPGGKKAK